MTHLFFELEFQKSYFKIKKNMFFYFKFVIFGKSKFSTRAIVLNLLIRRNKFINNLINKRKKCLQWN